MSWFCDAELCSSSLSYWQLSKSENPLLPTPLGPQTKLFTNFKAYFIQHTVFVGFSLPFFSYLLLSLFYTFILLLMFESKVGMPRSTNLEQSPTLYKRWLTNKCRQWNGARLNNSAKIKLPGYMGTGSGSCLKSPTSGSFSSVRVNALYSTQTEITKN